MSTGPDESSVAHLGPIFRPYSSACLFNRTKINVRYIFPTTPFGGGLEATPEPPQPFSGGSAPPNPPGTARVDSGFVLF